MVELIMHRVPQGLERLLSLPRDLDEAWPRPSRPIERAQASGVHRELFQEYEEELASNVELAMEWWKGRFSVKQRREKLNSKDALRAMYGETPAGPAAAPEIVWIVRKYWLECENRNKSLPKPQWVAPEAFLISWLMDGEHEVELKVLSGMIYWPIGLDKDGNWV